jgi:Domain of unknown function (DUF4226)
MIERPTPSDPAVDPRPGALLERHRTVAAADQVLADVLIAAHATTTTALRRLDEIEADLQAVVDNQNELGLDTPAGVRELQRLLSAKQRQIVSVVSDAAAEGDAKKAALQELLAQYSAAGGSSAG